MSYRRARSLQALTDQINDAYPDRDKASDGWIGDTSHSRRKSDHNPDSDGIVHAIDVDEDNARGDEVVGRALWQWLLDTKPKWVKYAIYEGHIISSYNHKDGRAWTERPYSGSNAHRAHVHISVYDDRAHTGPKFTRPGKETPVASEDSWLEKWPKWSHELAKKYATKHTEPDKKVGDMTLVEWLALNERMKR